SKSLVMADFQRVKLIFAAFLDVVLVIAIFLCPSLAIGKFELFRQSGGLLRFNPYIENG
ncbi:3262_t:CDS:2, partial [Cetraspora pellucida]